MLTHRGFVGATALAGAAAATGATAPPSEARERTAAAEAATTVRPGSPQYADLARGVNQREVSRHALPVEPARPRRGGR